MPGTPVQHRQVEGHETDKFLSYFDGGIEYLNGGIESGFNHVEPTEDEPFLFRVKGKKNISLTQVPLKKSSLNAGDSFILHVNPGHVWCWHGREARPMEKVKCNQWAENMCTLGTATVLDQGDGDEEYTDFWAHLGDDGEIGPNQDDDEGITEFSPLLFRVDGDATEELEQVASGSPIQKTSKVVACLQKDALDSGDVFLMDSGWELYVWIGSGADHGEKLAAMAAADRYAKMEPRALQLPVHILKEGHETELFNSYFE